MSMNSIDRETRRLEQKISDQNIRLSQLSINKNRHRESESNNLLLECGSHQDMAEGDQHKNPPRKRKKKTSKFKRWLRNTFCGQTSVQTTDMDDGGSRKSGRKSAKHLGRQNETGLTADSWKESLDHQLESQFIQAGTAIPNYVLQAHKNIKKMISERAFQKQAKQDQAEFKLAMQNLLAQQNQSNLKEAGSSKFAFQEEQKDDSAEADAVYQVISEQPETDFEDMVASNLV